uniref:Uncharacterized protein n=1 Tax=Oryza brachyantha TaxID=4533 RepID=J3M4C8_ORYBR
MPCQQLPPDDVALQGWPHIYTANMHWRLEYSAWFCLDMNLDTVLVLTLYTSTATIAPELVTTRSSTSI